MISEIRLSIGKQSVLSAPLVRMDATRDAWWDARGQESGFLVVDGEESWFRVHRVGAFLTRQGAAEVIGYPDPGVDLSQFLEAFFHGVIPWVLQQDQWECFHGSAVLTSYGVVAFFGPSGRGKSTLARAWMDRGAVPYADDTVAFVIDGEKPLAARLPQRIRLREPAASHYFARPAPANTLQEEGLSHNLQSTLRPLSSIYWLDPLREPDRGPAAVFQRIAGPEAFSLLLGQARLLSCQDPHRNRRAVRQYLSLVRWTPIFRLSLTAKLELLPEALDTLDRHQRELSGR